MKHMLIIGTGATGASLAFMIRQSLSTKWSCKLWDKGKKAGGRMNTHYDTNHSNSVDLGAQYISTSNIYFESNNIYYNDLIENGILVKFKNIKSEIENIPEDSADMQHFYIPSGISSIVTHFLKRSGYETCFGKVVKSIEKSNDKWKVFCDDGLSETFDAVVLTMPVPQILQLGGEIPQLCTRIPGILKNLQSVSYSSRFALGLFYPDSIELPFSWSMKYFTSDPCIRFIAINNRKCGIKGAPVSIVVHTCAPWSMLRIDKDQNIIQSEIISALTSLLPELSISKDIHFHKWQYSQVHCGYVGIPGCIELNVDSEPLLLLAGDAFTYSNLNGCLRSATAVIEKLNLK